MFLNYYFVRLHLKYYQKGLPFPPEQYRRPLFKIDHIVKGERGRTGESLGVLGRALHCLSMTPRNY